MNTVTPADRDQQSFAETALRLGGKTEEEARRTGAVDRADEQVESLFKPQYQTANSPIHKAVWDGHVPLDLFSPPPLPASAPCDRCMEASLEIVRRRRAEGQIHDEHGKVSPQTLQELAGAGYWGLLIDPRYGGQGAPFARFSNFLTRMATQDAMIAGLASIHGCIGAVDPVRTFGTPGAEGALSAQARQRPGAVRLRPDRAGRRLRPHRPAHHRRTRRRLLRRQRRKAVHHQRHPRPHRRPGGAARRQAGRARCRSADPGERAFPGRALWSVRPAARLQQRPALHEFPRAEGKPAQAADRRRSDHRLSRPEPGPRVAVCRSGRQHAA